MSQTQKRKGRRGSGANVRSYCVRICSCLRRVLVVKLSLSLGLLSSTIKLRYCTFMLTVQSSTSLLGNMQFLEVPRSKVLSPLIVFSQEQSDLLDSRLKVLSEISIERRILDFMTMPSRTARHAVLTRFPVRYKKIWLALLSVRPSNHSVLSGTGVHVSVSSLQERRVPPTETARRERVKFPPPGEALGAVTSLDTFC